ncbi:MAG: hypothetical protein QNJ72_37355 [Pleurocapsa sp. MO_226.B13]|nr:hypothetical protein [Pleurocapsa sp. MO_226.B13]
MKKKNEYKRLASENERKIAICDRDHPPYSHEAALHENGQVQKINLALWGARVKIIPN